MLPNPHTFFRYDSLLDGTLQFWAHTICSALGPLNESEIGELHASLGFGNKQRSRLNYYDGTHKAILRDAGNIIGAVHLDSIITSGALDQGVFIVMSRTFSKGFEPSSSEIRNGLQLWKESGNPWDEAQFQADRLNPTVEAGLYNVLLVDGIAGVSHRLGVGVVFLEAFHKANPSRHFITLG